MLIMFFLFLIDGFRQQGRYKTLFINNLLCLDDVYASVLCK